MIYLRFLLFLLIISCQVIPVKVRQQRSISGLFNQVEDNNSITQQIKLDHDYQWIIIPNKSNVISSIQIDDPQIDCVEQNIVKMHKQKATVYYLTDKSMIKCRSIENKTIKVHYYFYRYGLNQVGNEHIEKIANIFNSLKEKDLTQMIQNLKDLGMFDIFKRKVTLEQLRQLKIKPGDYIELEVWPQLKMVRCPRGDCQMNVNIFGLLEYDKMGVLTGSNQVKYQKIPPFLFFCGSRFAAGNIYFRADEKMSFSHVVNENGFNCDVNSFLLDSKHMNYQMELIWVSADLIQGLLLGKEQYFIKKKNNAIKDKVLDYIQQIQDYNTKIKTKAQKIKDKSQFDGYFELWWEPFDACENDDSNSCDQKELILTRSRLIYREKNKKQTKSQIVDLSLFPKSYKQLIEADEKPLAFVSRICPKDLDQLFFTLRNLAQQNIEYADFKQQLMGFEKESCHFSIDQKQKGKEYFYRWLLSSSPKEIEQQEIDLLIEDYRLIYAPKEGHLKQDLYQRGKIFFDLYMKNLKDRKVPFKRSRIIEVLKQD